MPTTLTNSEIQQLRRVLKSYEKNVRIWPKLRWLILLLAILCVALSVYYTWTLQNLADQFNYAAYGLKQSKFTDFLEGHVAVVTAQMSRHFGAMLFGITGLALLINVIVTWRGRANEIAMIAFLREVLDTHATGEKESDT